MYFSVGYKLEPMKFGGEYDAPPDLRAPQLGKLNVEYPEQARKNGVQGTVKVTATLGEDGKVHDIHIDQDLPSGVGTAVTTALQSYTFIPASINGKPVAMVVHVEYNVTLAYPEDDKSVAKPTITEKPEPEYPPKYASNRIKGVVRVQVLFRPDGTLKVGQVDSVMPKEFDAAVVEAAGKIRFQPAVHKKSKSPVTQQLTVEYEFK